MGACSRSLYALRVLRVHGLPSAVLHKVSRARLPYAWWGFAKQKHRNRLERLLQRMRRMEYLPSSTPMLLILSVLRRTTCLAPALFTVTMLCAPFSPYSCRGTGPLAETS